ncbi:MAG: hypothetical protein D3917_09880 [Candidatus Electrothrix sp. AX5]|nr:hypothetical protein [Candidatus Electrothrix sp. AX5]
MNCLTIWAEDYASPETVTQNIGIERSRRGGKREVSLIAVAIFFPPYTFLFIPVSSCTLIILPDKNNDYPVCLRPLPSFLHTVSIRVLKSTAGLYTFYVQP